MITAIIGYGLVVSTLAALAAWLLELAQMALRWPCKHAWTGGILAAVLVPGLVLGLREPGQGVSLPTTAATAGVHGAAEVRLLPAASPGGEANGGSLNDGLAASWALTSAVLVGAYAVSIWRLRRRAKTWRSASIDSSPVSIAPDIGPAVFGWLEPRVVFPHWLIEAPVDVQRLALAHEREHVAARDPQVLSGAMLLAALLPWTCRFGGWCAACVSPWRWTATRA